MDNVLSTYFAPKNYVFITEQTEPITGYDPLIIFDKNGIPGYLSQMSQILFFQFSGFKDISIKNLRSDKKSYKTKWQNPKSGEINESTGYSYLTFSEDLRINGKVEREKYNLPLIMSEWLDRGIDVSVNWHFTDGTGEAVKMVDGTLSEIYGEHFPIKPSIDREGLILTSIHIQLIKRIIAVRKRLIKHSDKCLMIDWVFELRNLINDSISLIDITLNQLYIKAEYNPLPEWKFDKNIVGARFSRRMKDKVKWVNQITGNELNFEAERESFNRLKRIRNHLNHFDPPTFVLVIEEACTWLNDIIIIANILVKIRLACSTPICLELAELMCQKRAIFSPKHGSLQRTTLDTNTHGYITSIWPPDIYNESEI